MVSAEAVVPPMADWSALSLLALVANVCAWVAWTTLLMTSLTELDKLVDPPTPSNGDGIDEVVGATHGVTVDGLEYIVFKLRGIVAAMILSLSGTPGAEREEEEEAAKYNNLQ